MAPNPQRRLLLALRKHVQAKTYFAVAYLGGRVVCYTCKTCGYSHQGPYLADKLGKDAPTDEAFIRRRVAYENQAPGMADICPRCTKRKRDERYPLPPRTP